MTSLHSPLPAEIDIEDTTTRTKLITTYRDLYTSIPRLILPLSHPPPSRSSNPSACSARSASTRAKRIFVHKGTSQYNRNCSVAEVSRVTFAVNMATQAAIFAETISGMKKAVKRKAYGTETPNRTEVYCLLLIILCITDSDSDSSIEQLTNRGNKLRKKARYVHEGQLAPPTGPVVYRRVRHIRTILPLESNIS